jgi:hypothetical protein
MSGSNENTVRNAADWRRFLLFGLGRLRGLVDNAMIVDHPMICDEWHFQRHCHVCFYNPAAANATPRTLIPCSTCYCAAHCTDASCAAAFAGLHTVEACENYMNGFASIVMSMQQGTHLVLCCNTRATTFSLPHNWKDYFTNKLTDFAVPYQLVELPPVMVSLIACPHKCIAYNITLLTVYISGMQGMLTDGLSLAMTLLNELTAVHDADYWAAKTRLRVHLVGTELNELLGCASRFEEILHWLPRCKELEMVMIFGNKEFYEQFKVEQQVENCTLCAGCTKDRVKLNIRSKCGFYHDLFTLEALAQDPPDVVMGCHTGMHDSGTPGKPSHLTETWEPTVRLLAQTNVPCIYTGYNEEETVRDRAKLVQWGAHIVTDGHLNPFRGLRPFPDIGVDNTFYYTNQSCIVTRGHV